MRRTMPSAIRLSLRTARSCRRRSAYAAPQPVAVTLLRIGCSSFGYGHLWVDDLCSATESGERVARTIPKQKYQEEIERAHQIVKNGILFSIEAPGQVAAIAGNQTLWDRPQKLLSPLKAIDQWTGPKIQKELFPLLQGELSYTLIARPE